MPESGLQELRQIELELKANFAAESGKDCATGTCS
jgi:hypothetical protein